MFDKKLSTPFIQNIVLACILVTIFSLINPVFISVQNIFNILLASSVTGVLAVGASLVIGNGGIDLSVGSTMAAALAITATLIGMDTHLILFIFTALLIGCSMGGINGLLIGKLHLPPFIVTLALLSTLRGVAYLATDGRPLYGLPDTYRMIGQGNFIGLPIPIIIFLCVVIFAHILLRHTVFGAYLLAIGDNTKAAHNTGISLIKNQIALYALSAVFATIAGIIFMGRINAIDPSAGQMYELSAITAAIIGGNQLRGGRASVIGAAIGAIIISMLQNGLNLLAISAYYQQLAIGIVLVIAMIANKKDTL